MFLPEGRGTRPAHHRPLDFFAVLLWMLEVRWAEAAPWQCAAADARAKPPLEIPESELDGSSTSNGCRSGAEEKAAIVRTDYLRQPLGWKKDIIEVYFIYYTTEVKRGGDDSIP